MRLSRCFFPNDTFPVRTHSHAAARLFGKRLLFLLIPMRILSALTALLILAGCSSIQLAPDPLQDATAVYSWEARGRMIFQCAYDSDGFFWRFIQTEGELLSDDGRRQAMLQPNFGITARDGSTLHAEIISQGEQTSSRDLRTAVFSARPEGRGMLEGIRYIARRQPSGGMPLVTCTASQRGQYLRVPFRARYVFYR